jgi:Spy/CpxP family protein refolding chaperone
MGCEKTAQPPEGEQSIRPGVQEKGGPKARVVKADDDTIRVRLLLADAVQRDLGLTPDQIRELSDQAKSDFARMRKVRQEVREILPPSFPSEESEARMAKFRAWEKDFRKASKEAKAKILAMLTPSQTERLKQIQLQAAIPAALARPEIIKALDISEEQLARIIAMRDQMDQEMAAKFRDLSNGSPEERRQKMIESMKASDQVQAEATKRILDVLTSEQRTKFQKLHGRRIETTPDYDALIPEDFDF